VEFHRRVGDGGVGMTTVAYLAVSPEGRTDRHCILLAPEVVAGLRSLTDAVHATGAAAAAQIGHAGPVANARSNGAPSLAPTRAFSPMGSLTRGATEDDIERITGEFLRRFSLPDSVDTQNIKAKAANGVLEVAIPKLAQVQPQRITVEAA